jgi:hypothetical protein
MMVEKVRCHAVRRMGYSWQGEQPSASDRRAKGRRRRRVEGTY